MITIIEYLNSKKSLHAFYKDIGEEGTDIVYDNYDPNSYCTDKRIKVTDHITFYTDKHTKVTDHITFYIGHTPNGTTIWNP